MDKLNLPSSKQTSQQELSANEFQEKLYNWLQDQGLISELRGHLRMQMVSAFQDNAPGASNSKQFPVSPKVQVLSILIAEFLLQQRFSYTLSVFVTEVPFIGQMFSQFSQPAIKKTLETGYKFSPREVEDIIETLGFAPGSELFIQAMTLYHNNGMEPLLLCILRAVSSHFKRKEPEFSRARKDSREQSGLPPQDGVNEKLRKSEKDTSSGLKEDWIDGMDESLVQSNVKLCPVTCLQEYMKRVHEEELCKVREEEADKYQRLLDEKLKEFEKKDLTEKHIGLKEWKDTVEAEFNDREKNLCQLASQLRAQHRELSEKVMFFEIESQEMKEKEKQLKDERERDSKQLEFKKSEIELQKARLNEAYEKLAADQEAVNKIQRNLLEKETTCQKKEVVQEREIEFLKKIQEQYDSLCQLLIEKKSNESPNTCRGGDNVSAMNVAKEDKGLQTSNVLDSAPNEYENELINRVEDEKRELNERVSQQRTRIEELTIRAAELSNQLQDAQVALQLVVPNQFAVTTPPLTAPPTLRLNPRPQWPPHIGSGEETSFAAMQTPVIPNPTTTTRTTTAAPTARHTGAIRRSELRRRPRRTVLQQSQTPVNLNLSSDDSTATTDEIIEEARIRLRRLEQESSNVQHNYEEFRNRQNNLAPTASIVFHPDQLRTLNPFDFRRTNYSSSFSNYPNINGMRPTNQSRSFGSRFSHLSVSRPVFSSFFSGYNLNNPDNDFRRTDVLHNSDNIAKELDESLANDNAVQMDTIPEQFVPPIRTMSPTDLNADAGSFQQPLKNKVVENTLKNHSLNNHYSNDAETKSPARVKFNNENDNLPPINNAGKPDDISDKKNGPNRLQFSKMVTVVSESDCDIDEVSTIPFNTFIKQSKKKYSVVQEPLKKSSKNDISSSSGKKKHIKIVGLGSHSDLTDDNKTNEKCRKDKSENESTDCTDDEKVQKNQNQNKKYYAYKQDFCVSNNYEQKRDKSVRISYNNSDVSDDGLKNNDSVEVLLQQRSIKTSSSSTQPLFSENKIQESSQDDSSQEENDNESVISSNVSELENQALVKSQSLPAPVTRSFFLCDQDGYSMNNFENGGISKTNVPIGNGVPADSESAVKYISHDGNSSDKDIEGKNGIVTDDDGDAKQEKRVVPAIKLSSIESFRDVGLNQIGNLYSQDPVNFENKFDYDNYPYPACYRNILNRMLRRNLNPNWLLKLKLLDDSSCIGRKFNYFENFNPLLQFPTRKSFFDTTDDDEFDL